MSALNECPSCGRTAEKLYFSAAICEACARAVVYGPLPLPRLEFVAPSRLVDSELYRAGLHEIFRKALVNPSPHWKLN